MCEYTDCEYLYQSVVIIYLLDCGWKINYEINFSMTLKAING